MHLAQRFLSQHSSFAASFSDDFDIMSSSGNRARSVDAQSDGVISHQPSTIRKETVRSGVDTPASLSSSSDSHGSVGGEPRAHPRLYDESHAESVRNIVTSPHASLVTAADLATCLAENTVRSAKIMTFITIFLSLFFSNFCVFL